jgi:hypothetical protein
MGLLGMGRKQYKQMSFLKKENSYSLKHKFYKNEYFSNLVIPLNDSYSGKYNKVLFVKTY